MQQRCQKNLSCVKIEKKITDLILGILSFLIYDPINFLLKHIVQFLECQKAFMPYSDVSFSCICEAKPVKSHSCEMLSSLQCLFLWNGNAKKKN